MNRWINGGMLVVCGGLLLTSGCKKETQQTSSGAASASAGVLATASASAAHQVAAKPAGFVKGETLTHLPPDCQRGRLYLDVSAIASLAGDTTKGLEKQWLGALGTADGETARKVLKTLRDGGFEPAAHVKELAMCITEKEEDMVFAVGLDLSQVKGDPLDLIVQAATNAGAKDKVEKKQEGKFSYLLSKDKDEGGALSVQGSSLVVARDLKALLGAQKGGGAKAFKDAAKSIAYVDISIEQGTIAGSITEVGADLKVAGSMKMTGKAADDLKKGGDGAVKQMKGMVDEMADELAKAPPFRGLAKPLKGLQLSADGDTLRAELTIPKKTLTEAIQATGEMKPEDLMQLMR